MRSKANIKSHPIHPMLVALPIGLWTFAFVADLLFKADVDGPWDILAGYTIAGGCVTALFAAIPGLIDYGTITDGSAAKKTATWHMVLNLSVVALYAVNFYLRSKSGMDVPTPAFILSVIGFTILGVSGWLGGDLVYKHKMGVIEEQGGRHEYDQNKEKQDSQARPSKQSAPRWSHEGTKTGKRQ